VSLAVQQQSAVFGALVATNRICVHRPFMRVSGDKSMNAEILRQESPKEEELARKRDKLVPGRFKRPTQ